MTVYSLLSATVQNWQITVFYRQLYIIESLQCFIGKCTELTLYIVLSATVQNWQFTVFIGNYTELTVYSVLSATVQNWQFTVFYRQMYRTESLQCFICNCTELTVYSVLSATVHNLQFIVFCRQLYRTKTARVTVALSNTACGHVLTHRTVCIAAVWIHQTGKLTQLT